MMVFDLTPLTRGAAAERRAVIQGFEIRWQTLVVAALSAIPGLLLTVILWPWLDSMAILVIPATVGAALWLINGRASRGMQLRNWQSLSNKARSDSGRFFVSGASYDPLATTRGVIQMASVPVGVATKQALPEPATHPPAEPESFDDWM